MRSKFVAADHRECSSVVGLCGGDRRRGPLLGI